MPTLSTISSDTNYYEILSLPNPRNVKGHNESKDELKAAYRRALLVHHPDKLTTTLMKDSHNRGGNLSNKKVYSIDLIMLAYQTLADPIRRTEYNKTLLKKGSRPNLGVSVNGTYLGVESFDLEEVAYDEATGIWSRPCRCGNEGYVFTETELEKGSAEGEIYVECRGCSLLIKILFSTTE